MATELPADYANLTLLLKSRHLKKDKRVDIFLPPGFQAGTEYSLLVMNDGQDAQALHLRDVLHKAHHHGHLRPFVVAAAHVDSARLNEYGTAGVPDYAGRGNLAGSYTSFVLQELLPLLRERYRLSPLPAHNVFAGFSLGGLSAFDITWQHPQVFGRVGVFSGAFWWRRHSKNDELAMTDRIMHGVVRGSAKKEGLKFWLQAGTEDELEDRNHNGIIDAIEDTLDLIAELAMKGYDVQRDIRYVEIQGGQHNQRTWSQAMPDFLAWAFGKHP
jgi:enterochelin esterase-like enzyme